MNHVRTCRWHVHEPVQTLANSFISFCRPSQGKRKCKQIPPSAPKKEQFIRQDELLFFDFERDLNGSGVRKRAGGTFSPRPGLPRRAAHEMLFYSWSKHSETCFRCSMMGRCWGQIPSHWPQAMQSPARPKSCVSTSYWVKLTVQPFCFMSSRLISL